MATVQELVTKYTFDVDTKPLDSVEDKIGGLISFTSKLALGATAAVGAIFGFAKITANAGDEILATSQKIGMSVESLSRLQFAAKLSNLDAGSLSIGMRFLAKNMTDAAKGTGDAYLAFRKLGISFKDSHGKMLPTDEVLLKVSNKLSKMPDGVAKTALAMDIFGKSGSDLIPLLNEGAAGIQKMMNRSDELGYTMSTELAKAGDEFNDSLDETMAGLTGVRNIIGAKLLPALIPLIQKFTSFLVVNRQLIASKIDTFFKAMGTFINFVFNVFKKLAPVLNLVVDNIEAIGKAFVFIMGINLAYQIGLLATTLYTLVSAFSLVQLGAIATWASMVAGPLLIGAAIMALILIVEDLYLFLTDPEADTIFSGISDWFDNLPAWGMLLTSVLLTPLRAVVAQFKNVWEIMKLITGNSSIGDALSNIATNQANIIAPGSSFSEQLGFNPAEKPAAQPTTPYNNSVMAPTQVTNNINVGEGADVTGIGKSVTQATKQGLDESLRGAQRSFKKKGGY